MPPPPCELLVTDRPSMRDGLHWKLLGNRLVPLLLQLPLVNSVVPAGNVSAVNGPGLAVEIAGKFTPFDSTVMPAPSYAPRSVGSCSCSSRLPFSVVSQPTVAHTA